ncbi:FAD-binding oxidoreductase [Lentzea sp.]|uniref:FAD-binding oxidoreductase n=1 Tax=Lentzea sp. TaxID=56099 RepID=UPI002BABB287|nr:FAD-binding oxidoreductase [Lentzea sp.]HUQ60975.1 FAD-binding oxidoreductase [Lentzea sp.]
MTTRSWWGWGTVEDAVTPEERRALADRVRAVLPDADLTFHEPPDPMSLDVPESRIQPPGDLYSTGLIDRLGHSRGQAYRDITRNLAGKVGPLPDAVARPRTEQDIVDVLDWCASNDVAVIPFGGGTSVVGGVEPRDLDRAVTLDLQHLDRVLEVDPTSRAARIQAGVLGPSLEAQLKPHHLTLRHFPQSFEFSTLGGWLATRAGGHYATLHTHIDDLTESLRVVTPAGVSESRRLPGSGAGPSPDRLFLGSEGTLGVITEAWMRLQSPPVHRAGASVRFASWDQAVEATRLIAQSGLHPANCRLLDPAEAFLNAGSPHSVLILAFESADHPVDAQLARALELCGEGEVTEGASARWRKSFLRMPYQRDAMAQHAMITETFETACTWDRFPTLHASVTEAATTALREVCGIGMVTCRFTHVYPDGPAPYYGIYAPGRWGSLTSQWDEIKAAVSEALTNAGGTITHHHAIGRDHMPWYERQRPEVFNTALSAAKAALDPSGILNPGVLTTQSTAGSTRR